MAKKIIVAGGGHGGIAAAMLLAKKGFDVTVYKKAVTIIKDKGLRNALLKVLGDMGKLTASAASMPNYYSRLKVQQWAQRYDAIFSE